MRFALAGYGGSRGDVEPLAAPRPGLLRRGHDARLGVDPEMVGFVESLGLEAVSRRPELWDMGDGDIADDAPAQNPVSQAMAAWTATLQTLADGADLLLVVPYLERTAANVAEYY